MKLALPTPIEEAHERLLLTAMKILPDHLAKVLQSTDRFDAFVVQHEPEIRDDLTRVIAAARADGEHQVVNLYVQALEGLPALSPPALPAPQMHCGQVIRHDDRADGRADGRADAVVDLLITLHIPDYEVGVRSAAGLDPQPFESVGDTVTTSFRSSPVTIVAEAFPAEMTLRRIIERLGDVDLGSHHVLAIVERPEIFHALASSWDVVLIENGTITSSDLVVLEDLPTYTLNRTPIGMSARRSTEI